MSFLKVLLCLFCYFAHFSTGQILKLEPNGALCRGNTQCQNRCCYIPRSSVTGDGICINAPLGLYELCGEQSDLPQSQPRSQSLMANSNRYQNQKMEKDNNNNFYSNANQQRSSAPLAPERSYSTWNNVPPPPPLAPQVYPDAYANNDSPWLADYYLSQYYRPPYNNYNSNYYNGFYSNRPPNYNYGYGYLPPPLPQQLANNVWYGYPPPAALAGPPFVGPAYHFPQPPPPPPLPFPPQPATATFYATLMKK